MPLEDHAERVLDLVATIPEGRVLAYGDIAKRLGGMGPRTVGTVMSRYGSDVPWWRVIRSDGRPPQGLEDEALGHWRAEGTPDGGRSGRRRPRRHGAGEVGLRGSGGRFGRGRRRRPAGRPAPRRDLGRGHRRCGARVGLAARSPRLPPRRRLGARPGVGARLALRRRRVRARCRARVGTSAGARGSTTLPSMAVREQRSTRWSTRVPRAGGR